MANTTLRALGLGTLEERPSGTACRRGASYYCLMTALRQAVAEDDQALAAISFECWDESNDPGDLWARNRPFFGPPTDARVDDVIVATIGDRPVGYVRTFERSSVYGDRYIAGRAFRRPLERPG